MIYLVFCWTARLPLRQPNAAGLGQHYGQEPWLCPVSRDDLLKMPRRRLCTARMRRQTAILAEQAAHDKPTRSADRRADV
jgi:hypothetical protein